MIIYSRTNFVFSELNQSPSILDQIIFILSRIDEDRFNPEIKFVCSGVDEDLFNLNDINFYFVWSK